MNETIHVLDKRLSLLQPEDGFKTSIDAVLLGAACPAKKGDQILDLGCGVGSAGLCTLYRVPDSRLTGIDVLPASIALANKNAKLNHKDARSVFIAEDIRDFEGEPFDHVICNPPYLGAGSHIPSPKEEKQIAIGFGEDDIDLKDWIDAAYRNLRKGGSLTMINRADATDKIIRDMGKKFGAIEIIPLWPKLYVTAKRVIIRGLKDRKSPATLHPGLVLHNLDGSYSDAANRVLKEAHALFSD